VYSNVEYTIPLLFVITNKYLFILIMYYAALKLKVKLSLCLTKHHATKTYRGSGGIAPRILDLGTR
jgi:hypothetical protein